MSKIIYQPKGKAGEYAKWACNLYNGCSNRCEYCYNRKGLAHALLGKDEVTLKSGFKNEKEALDCFIKEFDKYKDKIKADGGELFFNFVSDPCLPETWALNWDCMAHAMNNGVKCRMLTKRAEVATYLKQKVETMPIAPGYLKVGFTLTGMDDLEPGASLNAERVMAFRKLTNLGFVTWASIEPVIDIKRSEIMIDLAFYSGCREFKIGLLSGKKEYSKQEVIDFKHYVDETYYMCNVVWKESVTEFIK